VHPTHTTIQLSWPKKALVPTKWTVPQNVQATMPLLVHGTPFTKSVGASWMYRIPTTVLRDVLLKKELNSLPSVCNHPLNGARNRTVKHLTPKTTATSDR